MTQFNPRYTEPSDSNPYFIETSYGGYDKAIVIDESNGSCLANCVGYVNGRSREMSDNQCAMPACDAKDFLNNTSYETGTEPKLGAVIVWGGGDYGHVGIVENIHDDMITVSQSNWGGTRFFLTEHPINDLDIPYHPFLGFIYNPFIETDHKIQAEPYAVFRLYNPNTGEHFYTADVFEAMEIFAAGWQYDGVAFHHAGTEGVPLFRLRNPETGFHMFTTGTDERDNLVTQGWILEGVAFNVFTGSTQTAIYCAYNPNNGDHFFTSNYNEYEDVVSKGWDADRGIAFYAN